MGFGIVAVVGFGTQQPIWEPPSGNVPAATPDNGPPRRPGKGPRPNPIPPITKAGPPPLFFHFVSLFFFKKTPLTNTFYENPRILPLNPTWGTLSGRNLIKTADLFSKQA